MTKHAKGPDVVHTQKSESKVTPLKKTASLKYGPKDIQFGIKIDTT